MLKRANHVSGFQDFYRTMRNSEALSEEAWKTIAETLLVIPPQDDATNHVQTAMLEYGETIKAQGASQEIDLLKYRVLEGVSQTFSTVLDIKTLSAMTDLTEKETEEFLTLARTQILSRGIKPQNVAAKLRSNGADISDTSPEGSTTVPHRFVPAHPN